MRKMLVAGASGRAGDFSIELDSEKSAEAAELAKTSSAADLARLIEIILEKRYNFKDAGIPQLPLELAAVEFASDREVSSPEKKIAQTAVKNGASGASIREPEFKVKEAPPGIRGDRAQGGTKSVILETGVQINVPLFIETDDVVEINTETGEYVRRVE